MRAARNVMVFFVIPVCAAFWVGIFRDGGFSMNSYGGSVLMTIIGFPALFMIGIYLLVMAFSRKDK